MSGVDSAISRLSSLSDSAGTIESYSYLGLDNVVGTTSGTGGTESTLDRFGRIAEMTATTWTSTLVMDYSYTYDDNSNVLTKTDNVNTGLSQTYSYDNVNELKGYAEGTISGGVITGTPTSSQSLEYDALGNMTSNTINSGTATTYSANAQNEYTSISSGTTPTYDANGNMTTDSAGLKYVYDAWNRVVAVKDSGGSTLETFKYDGLGRRIAVTDTSTSTTTNFIYSAAGQVLEESVGGVYTQRDVWSPVYVNALLLRDTDTSGTGLTATGSSYTPPLGGSGCELERGGIAG